MSTDPPNKAWDGTLRAIERPTQRSSATPRHLPTAQRDSPEEPHAELVVENPTEKTVRVVVNPYGGAFPYGGTSPFTLGLGGEPAVKYTGKLYPPEPPRPLAIDFPAKARVRFSASIELENYGWEGEPQVTPTWGFYFARKPVEGRLGLRLPKK